MTIKYFNELAEPQMLAIPVKAFLQQVQHSYMLSSWHFLSKSLIVLGYVFVSPTGLVC